jgi:hypothetical protein
MKKIILIAFFTIFSLQNCFADQLQLVSQSQATKAVALLKSQKTVILFCGCCDSIPKRIIQVTGAYFKPANTKIEGVPMYLVILQGKNTKTNEIINEEVDLVNVYIKKNSSAVTVGKFLNYKCDPCVENIDWEFEPTIKSANPGNTSSDLNANLVLIQNDKYVYLGMYNFNFEGKTTSVMIVQSAPINSFISRDNFLSYATFNETSIKQQIIANRKNVDVAKLYDLNSVPDLLFSLEFNKNGIQTKLTDKGKTSEMNQDWQSLIKTKERF